MHPLARVAESVDALVSNTSSFTGVPVRPRPRVLSLPRGGIFFNITTMMNLTSSEKQRQFDKHYLEMASVWSKNSYCKRRRVGALIVKDKMIISDGFNGTPEGFENDCEDENNVTKTYVLHAEANAITKVAKSGNNSLGATLYVTTSPCIECSKLIIQSGIKRVVYLNKYHNTEGLDLLVRANIEIVNLSEDEGI